MKKSSSFSGSLGFVLAAAGSAVGVGNIWRFPYLCAKDGGGLFLLVYLVLVLTFGFTLLTTDVAIGRRTKQNALNAFATLNKKWKFLGYLTFLVPTLIMTYYSVIGGWITKYFTLYLVSSGDAAAQDGFFTSFITSPVSPIVFMLIFLALTAWVVYCGVEKGIEKYSRYIMPGLLLLIIGIAIFSLTLSYTDESGMTRTGIEGLLVYIKPDFTGLTVQRFLNIALDAMSQLFFSLSVSMGIMITYGSYVKDDVNLNKANNQIEIFDTGVAFLAGLMIIPAVYVFLGTDGMASGPSLTFISLPKVFAAMGGVGRVIGAVFFLALGFAALTSCVSVMETLVANCMEIFHKSRKEMCAARERGDRAVRHRGGDGLHALVVHRRRDGEARLDHVDAQLFKLAGHFDLFRQIHAAAGGLLAVSQGRVKNFNAFHGVFLLLFFLSHSNKKSLRLFP